MFFRPWIAALGAIAPSAKFPLDINMVSRYNTSVDMDTDVAIAERPGKEERSLRDEAGREAMTHLQLLVLRAAPAPGGAGEQVRIRSGTGQG